MDVAGTVYVVEDADPGASDYWYQDEWASWYQSHLQGRIGSLTRVDRRGEAFALSEAHR